MIDVSIIIPVFNSSSTISETLNSLLNQSFRNWEAICVDDGSTDGSVDIIKDYCKRDSRINYIQRDCLEKGGSVCRNIGGNAAKGEFLIFLDSDDLLASWCIEKRMEVIKGGKYGMVVFPIGYFTNNPTEYTVTRNLHSKNHLCRFISGSPTWQTMQPIYRAEVFKQLGGFDISFPRYQDVEFGIRAIINCRIKIVRDVKPDCFFRMAGDSGFITPKKAENAIKAAELLLILVNKLWGKIESRRKKTAVLGLMINVVSLEMSIRIPLKKFFEDISPQIDLKKILSKKEFLFLKFIVNMNSNKINKFLLKVISKIIDIELDRSY